MSRMAELVGYVHKYVERGECTCGRCVDSVDKPGEKQPVGHTADMVFFRVKAKEGADAETLRKLVKESGGGEYYCVDMFDGKEHGYMEVGGWMGDQGTALMLMGLGSLLGLWKLMTPVTVLKLDSDDPTCKQLAGMGMVTVKAEITG